MKWGEGWRQWGVILPICAMVAIGAGFGYRLVRTFIPFSGSFQEQLLEAQYPDPQIETAQISIGGKGQRVYIGRSQFGTCLFRLERRQQENGYKLVEVNGRPLVIEDDPSREQSVASAAAIGITC